MTRYCYGVQDISKTRFVHRFPTQRDRTLWLAQCPEHNRTATAREAKALMRGQRGTWCYLAANVEGGTLRGEWWSTYLGDVER